MPQMRHSSPRRCTGELGGERTLDLGPTSFHCWISCSRRECQAYMAAFDSTIFGVGVTELRSFCAAMLTPTLGFVFLYLLGKPLKKLPILEIDSDYQPPRWVLPIFALGSACLISGAFSGSVFLNVLKSRPSNEIFLHQYQKDVDFTKATISQSISSASLELDRYDGASTFQFFVNGYRLAAK